MNREASKHKIQKERRADDRRGEETKGERRRQEERRQGEGVRLNRRNKKDHIGEDIGCKR